MTRRIIFGQDLGSDWRLHNLLQRLHSAMARGNHEKAADVQRAIDRRNRHQQLEANRAAMQEKVPETSLTYSA